MQNHASVFTLGLYSAFRAWRAIVFKSSRQSKLTVATMFLDDKRKQGYFDALGEHHSTYWSVGVRQLAPGLAPGVAAGVAGVGPFPFGTWFPTGKTGF